MAYLKTSDSIIINATLTDKGKKLLSRGEFRVAKFTLGDDEIDYSLYSVKRITESDEGGDAYRPALENSLSLEAYRDTQSNIQYGLQSFEGAKLSPEEYRTLVEDSSGLDMHAYILNIPVLKVNKKLDYSPTMTGSVYYLSANNETTEKLNSIANFRFLTTDTLENVKFVVESSMDVPKVADYPAAEGAYKRPTKRNTELFILRKYLLDMEYFLYADNRFITSICGIKKNSLFRNYPDNNAEINFITDKESPPVSYQSEFDNFATYITKGIRNENYMPAEVEWTATEAYKYSDMRGPKGGIVAFNPLINQELKGTSTSTRDFRYSDFGEINQIVFSELPTSKFDYIDTTIYIIGATTNSRTHIPLRIIRYVGT